MTPPQIGTLVGEDGGAASTLTLYMAEACYDERSARAHVKRFKEILAPQQARVRATLARARARAHPCARPPR